MDTGVTVEQCLAESLSPQALLVPLPDAKSSEIIERLKQEADQHWDIDPRRSLEFAGRIIAIGKARGDKQQIALGMMSRGDALKFLGDTSEAWETLDQAGEMFLAAGDEVGWGRTRIGRLHLGIMLNCVDETLEEAECARQIFIRHGETEKLMRITFQTAYVYNYLGDQPKTLELYQSALAMAESLGEAGDSFIGKITLNMGVAYENLGDLIRAQECYKQAYGRFVVRGENLLLAIAETSLASLAQTQGHYCQALELLNQSLEHVANTTELEAAKTKWHILDCYLNLHKHDEARQIASEIVAVFRQANDLFELSRSLLQLATAEAESGNFSAALRALDEAEAIFLSEGAQVWTAITWLKRGQIMLCQGDPQAAYQNAFKAAASFDCSSQKINFASAILLQGQSSFALGDHQAAHNAGDSTLRIAQRYAIPSLRYSAHLLLGTVADRLKELRRAERHYRAAVATSERVQRYLTITLRPGFLEVEGEAWRRLIGLHLSAGQFDKAFETLERAKSQVLLSYLVNRESLHWAQDDPHSRVLIDELEYLRGEHQWYYRLAHELPIDLNKPPSSKPEQYLVEVKNRERRMRAITEQLYLRGGENRSENPAPNPTLKDIQVTLDKNTLLIEFYDDGNQLWAFIVDEERIQANCLQMKSEMAQQLQTQLRANISVALNPNLQSQAAHNLTRHAQLILQRLYASLIKPLEENLEGKKRLIIVPYGNLHTLPFHLLYNESTYLIENFEVLILPAAGLATQSGPRRQPGAMVLANSWEGRLPNTQDEARTVQHILGGELYLEEAANQAALRAKPCQVLHIAAHGQFRLDQPDLSYIQLANGQLYSDDLFQHDLSYELVTLSACETGQVKASGGDELIGLGRGFLYAGVGALVLSLWQVADETTASLMEVMYKSLKKGLTKSAGLRLAQLELLRQKTQLHPAFWGAFELIGDDRPLSKEADGDKN